MVDFLCIPMLHVCLKGFAVATTRLWHSMVRYTGWFVIRKVLLLQSSWKYAHQPGSQDFKKSPPKDLSPPLTEMITCSHLPKFLAMKIVETTNSRLFLVDCLSQNIIISSFLYCHQPPTSKCLMASAKRRSTSSVNSPDWAVGYTDMICKWRVLPPTSSLQLRSLIRGTFNKDSDKI